MIILVVQTTLMTYCGNTSQVVAIVIGVGMRRAWTHPLFGTSAAATGSFSELTGVGTTNTEPAGTALLSISREEPAEEEGCIADCDVVSRAARALDVAAAAVAR